MAATLRLACERCYGEGCERCRYTGESVILLVCGRCQRPLVSGAHGWLCPRCGWTQPRP